MGNIVGEKFDDFVVNQINARQNLYGKGFGSTQLSPSNLLLLNNRNAWIKMASGVAIEGSIGKQKLKDIFAQSPDQTLTEPEYANLQDTGLAKNLVLPCVCVLEISVNLASSASACTDPFI